MDPWHKKQTGLPFAEALAKARALLAQEGFGIITEIDVKETFRKKLAIDFENYVILGACHPSSALRLLQADKDLGLMLPCNVVVYEQSGAVFVAAAKPTAMLALMGASGLAEFAKEVEEKLSKVVAMA